MNHREILKEAGLSLDQMGILHRLVYGTRDSFNKLVPTELRGSTIYAYLVWLEQGEKK
jgi:hypothetical protein